MLGPVNDWVGMWMGAGLAEGMVAREGLFQGGEGRRAEASVGDLKKLTVGGFFSGNCG